MRVRDILSLKGRALFTVAPETELGEAVATMAEHDIGSVVVMQGSEVVGLLTFREVLCALLATQNNWSKEPVARWMSAAVVLGPEMELDEVRIQMLATHQRYYPVVEEGILLGVVSFHDVARAVLEMQRLENATLKAMLREINED